MPTIRRLVWSYTGGFFEDNGNHHWAEQNPSGPYYFKEMDRNGDFIELYDNSRDCAVRLYNTEMYLKGFHGIHPDFTKYYDGRWTK